MFCDIYLKMLMFSEEFETFFLIEKPLSDREVVFFCLRKRW